MKDYSFLYKLLQTSTPSGLEFKGNEVFAEYVSQFASKHITDKVGNTVYKVGNGATKILISAHIDEIGLKVQFIDDNGFIYVIKNGGVDLKTLFGASVKILHDDKEIIGVIGKTPIHVERRNNSENKEIKITDIKIDCGFNNKEEALKSISIGDCVVINQPIIQLNNSRIACKGLDDKAGVYVVAKVLERLAEVKLNNVEVYGATCVQEETTWNGATSLIKMINPNISIDYDVTFATDDGNVEAKEWGDVKLGNGGCIVHSPDCTPSLVKKLQDISKICHVPTQEFALGGSMTDTNPLKQFGFDVETALLSIPLRNMHTQVEVVDLNDLDALIQLTTETILAIDSET